MRKDGGQALRVHFAEGIKVAMDGGASSAETLAALIQVLGSSIAIGHEDGVGLNRTVKWAVELLTDTVSFVSKERNGIDWAVKVIDVYPTQGDA